MKTKDITPKEIQAARENLANLEANYKAKHETKLRALPAQVGLNSIGELIKELTDLGTVTAIKAPKTAKAAKATKPAKKAKAEKAPKAPKATKAPKAKAGDRSHRLTPAEKISLEADLKNNMPAKEASEKYGVSVNNIYYTKNKIEKEAKKIAKKAAKASVPAKAEAPAIPAVDEDPEAPVTPEVVAAPTKA